HGKRFVSRPGVYSQSDGRSRLGVPVRPGGEITPHHFAIGTLALDVRDVVLFEREPDGGLQIALEGEIDVAAIEHERAVYGAGFRKACHHPAGPVRERACAIRPAPD